MNDGYNLRNTYRTGMAQDLYGQSSHCQQRQLKRHYQKDSTGTKATQRKRLIRQTGKMLVF